MPTSAETSVPIDTLSAAGVPVYASVSPVVPAITDHEIEHILEAVAQAGAKAAFFLPVRLPFEVAPLFEAWLETHHPDRAGKVLNIIRSIRQGRENDPNFFTRMRGSGPWAELLAKRFAIACKRFGLNKERIVLRTDLFRPPEGAQMRLF